jgi:hypothetical protein
LPFYFVPFGRISIGKEIAEPKAPFTLSGAALEKLSVRDDRSVGMAAVAGALTRKARRRLSTPRHAF